MKLAKQLLPFVIVNRFHFFSHSRDAVLSRHSVDDPHLRNEFTTTLPIANRNEPSNSSALDLDSSVSTQPKISFILMKGNASISK